jgi:hypothetical protein
VTTPDDVPQHPELTPRFPRIGLYEPRAEPAWPPAWGYDPTERDLVAMVLDELLEAEEARGTPRGAAAELIVPRGTAVSLKDYRSPALKGWGAGWPACTGAKGNLVTITADRSGAKFSVHRRISVMFDELIDRMEHRGYLCKPVQCGAYNCRAISGTNSSSLHAWAIAGDVNWTDNPYTATGRHTMPLWVPREVFNPYGFAWGGDYTGARKDFMHIEFLGTPQQADEQTARILAERTPPPGTKRVLEVTSPAMNGEDVREVQRVLTAWYSLPPTFADGFYGPGTAAYVRRAQDGTPPLPRLEADGIVGPATRRKLGIAP